MIGAKFVAPPGATEREAAEDGEELGTTLAMASATGVDAIVVLRLGAMRGVASDATLDPDWAAPVPERIEVEAEEDADASGVFGDVEAVVLPRLASLTEDDAAAEFPAVP